MLWLSLLAGCVTPKRPPPDGIKHDRAVETGASDDPAYDVEVVESARGWPSELSAVRDLARTVRARIMDLENPCLEGDGGGQCYRRALDRLFLKLDGLSENAKSTVRILHLGDSHIAADYITRTVRERLQERFGGKSRGYVHSDQRNGFGGRRLDRTPGWRRTRMVDEGQERGAFGFSGVALESLKSGSKIDYLIQDEDRVVVYYEASRSGGSFDVLLDGASLGRVEATETKPRTEAKAFSFPKKEGERKLTLVSLSVGVRIYGLSLERAGGGLLYDSIGPVGADANVYSLADESSMKSHIESVRPDLVVVMLGGNDALKVRQGKATLADVEASFDKLLDRVARAAPDADCMLWSPMDAASRNGEAVESKEGIGEVRAVQRKVASRRGCAFWDMYEAMGGHGSASRWLAADILMQDLVHPKRAGGELLGHLFAMAFLRAYDSN
ncbi:MAG: hypothetical protein HY791_09405 [Deltaproteobacteria bacterium]|nr:hypothetical protein [Deltaproteobacteria bacterium]